MVQKLRDPMLGDRFKGKKFCSKVNGEYIYMTKNEKRERIIWNEEDWEKFLKREIVPEFGRGDYMILGYFGYAKIKCLFRGWVDGM